MNHKIAGFLHLLSDLLLAASVWEYVIGSQMSPLKFSLRPLGANLISCKQPDTLLSFHNALEPFEPDNHNKTTRRLFF